MVNALDRNQENGPESRLRYQVIDMLELSGAMPRVWKQPENWHNWRNRFIEQEHRGSRKGVSVLFATVRNLQSLWSATSSVLKQAHPHWGPRKIRIIYARKLGVNLTNQGLALAGASTDRIPSVSSLKQVLEHSGLMVKRVQKRSSESGRLSSGRKGQAPNKVWTVDFKGWWLNPDSVRIEPLTVRDEFSRMLLELRAVENAKTGTIKAYFERLFEMPGLPDAIRMDNGPPFASPNGLFGLSQLSVCGSPWASPWNEATRLALKTMAHTSGCIWTCAGNCRQNESDGTSMPSISGGTNLITTFGRTNLLE